MFDNIGNKIKSFAKGFFVVEIIVGYISGIAIGVNTEWSAAFWSILIFFLCPFGAWASAIFIYGLGQLIENSDILVANSNQLIQDQQKHNKSVNFKTPQNNSSIAINPPPKPIHTWRCGTCGNTISENPCPFCNK